jgi:hypothetical protein
LLASLWLLEQGCLDLEEKPILAADALQGLSDTVQIISSMVLRDLSMPLAVRNATTTLTGLLVVAPADIKEVTRRLAAALGLAEQLIQAVRDGVQPQTELMYWCLRLERGIYAWQVTVDEFLPWLENADSLSAALGRKPTLEGELLEEMERLGRKGGNWGGDADCAGEAGDGLAGCAGL